MKSVLSIMIKCLYGRPKVLINMIPVFNLNSKFLFQNISNVVDLLHHLKGLAFSLVSVFPSDCAIRRRGESQGVWLGEAISRGL